MLNLSEVKEGSEVVISVRVLKCIWKLNILILVKMKEGSEIAVIFLPK